MDKDSKVYVDEPFPTRINETVKDMENLLPPFDELSVSFGIVVTVSGDAIYECQIDF